MDSKQIIVLLVGLGAIVQGVGAHIVASLLVLSRRVARHAPARWWMAVVGNVSIVGGVISSP